MGIKGLRGRFLSNSVHAIIARFCVSLALLATLPQARSQVVNIENRRLHTDTVRRAGEITVSFLYNNVNNNPLLTFRGNAVYQLKSKNKKNLWLLTGNYDLAKAQQANLVNSSFAHLRFNHKVNNWLRWEAFTQTQTNTPLGIQFRWLTGTGPRFKIQLSQHANIYLGSLYMYEVEHTLSQQEEKRNYDHRNSSYASVSITIPSLKADIVSTSYWQPLYRDISDYRLTTETRMDFRITRQFRLFARTNFFFDSQPPKGIRRRAINTEQGFGFNF